MIPIRYIAEWSTADGWLLLLPSGDVRAVGSPAEIQALVARLERHRAVRLERDGIGVGMVIAQLEWRNVPAGFQAPDAGGA